MQLLIPLLASVGPGAVPPPLFTEVGARARPGVTTTCGSPQKDWILEVDGGGLALGDFDRDGDIDLVVVDGSTVERAEKGEPGNPPRLFLNRGDGTFAAAGEACRVGITIGYALAPLDGRDANGLLKRADAAMYAGKQAGRHCLTRGQATVGLSAA